MFLQSTILACSYTACCVASLKPIWRVLVISYILQYTILAKRSAGCNFKCLAVLLLTLRLQLIFLKRLFYTEAFLPRKKSLQWSLLTRQEGLPRRSIGPSVCYLFFCCPLVASGWFATDSTALFYVRFRANCVTTPCKEQARDDR